MKSRDMSLSSAPRRCRSKIKKQENLKENSYASACRQECKLGMSSPTWYFNHSLPYPILIKPRKSCYGFFWRLKSYPEITSPTENYEQIPQTR